MGGASEDGHDLNGAQRSIDAFDLAAPMASRYRSSLYVVKLSAITGVAHLEVGIAVDGCACFRAMNGPCSDCSQSRYYLVAPVDI